MTPEVGQVWRMKDDEPGPWGGSFTRYEIIGTAPGWVRVQPDLPHVPPRAVKIKTFHLCYEPVPQTARDMQAEYVEAANRG